MELHKLESIINKWHTNAHSVHLVSAPCRRSIESRACREPGVHNGRINGRPKAHCNLQPGMAEGDWDPFSSSGMNRGEACIQAHIMSLPHSYHRWITLLNAAAYIDEQSKRALRQELQMFSQQDNEEVSTHMHGHAISSPNACTWVEHTGCMADTAFSANTLVLLLPNANAPNQSFSNHTERNLSQLRLWLHAQESVA